MLLRDNASDLLINFNNNYINFEIFEYLTPIFNPWMIAISILECITFDAIDVNKLIKLNDKQSGQIAQITWTVNNFGKIWCKEVSASTMRNAWYERNIININELFINSVNDMNT